ncbi:MAG: hypothetical protein H6592_15370 [Flavobacteriales bacterium]|nr:hypothetical protein [Flavobacteriales bacterium]
MGSSTASIEVHIVALVAGYTSSDQQLFQSLRKALRQRFPTLNELVYDYGKKVVIGYSPTEAGGEGLVALSLDADGVRVYLTNGSKLPDPHKLLRGKAGARYLTPSSSKDLVRPEVEAQMAAAEKLSKMPLPATGSGQTIIKATAAAKRSGKKE